MSSYPGASGSAAPPTVKTEWESTAPSSTFLPSPTSESKSVFPQPEKLCPPPRGISGPPEGPWPDYDTTEPFPAIVTQHIQTVAQLRRILQPAESLPRSGFAMNLKIPMIPHAVFYQFLLTPDVENLPRTIFPGPSRVIPQLLTLIHAVKLRQILMRAIDRLMSNEDAVTSALRPGAQRLRVQLKSEISRLVDGWNVLYLFVFDIDFRLQFKLQIKHLAQAYKCYHEV